MKNYLILLLYTLTLLLSGCSAERSADTTEKTPFVVTAEPLKLTKGDEKQTVRMLIIIISNQTDSEFRQVSYTVSFNKEIQTIADGAVPPAYPASEPMDVTTKEKAAQANSTAEKPSVTGFSFERSIDLPADAGNLKNAFREITVAIKWDGGSQTEVIPLTWKK